MRGEEFVLGEWNVKQIGICYKRQPPVDPTTKQIMIDPKTKKPMTSGGGHCIVLKEAEQETDKDGNIPEKATRKPNQYLCFQHNTDGKDVWEDARGIVLPKEEDRTRVIGAFAIIDHEDIPRRERSVTPSYVQGNKNAPSATAMVTNTLATIAAPAGVATLNGLVTHLSKSASSKP